MLKLVNYTLKSFLALAASFAVYLVGVVTYGTITEHNFDAEIKLSASSENVPLLSETTFEVITWNVGFFGLGKESDFFYDGGEDVFQTKEIIQKNLNGVIDLIEKHKNVDFFLLQEVDSFSWRSHELNFLDEYKSIEPKYQSHFGMNYASAFVPIPIFNPLGPTYGGLYSMSKFPVLDAFRYDLRTESLWPKRMFYLKRCFLAQRIQLEEKELLLINVHNSAYDKSGAKKSKELRLLMAFAEEEFTKGNYVVIGGDWNQSPPNYSQGDIPEKHKNESFTNEDIPKDWAWVADTSIPTNRKLDKPYSKEASYTSVIDHYLVSPNVQVDSVAVIDMDFEFSDHQPVYLKVSIGQ